MKRFRFWNGSFTLSLCRTVTWHSSKSGFAYSFILNVSEIFFHLFMDVQNYFKLGSDQMILSNFTLKLTQVNFLYVCYWASKWSRTKERGVGNAPENQAITWSTCLVHSPQCCYCICPTLLSCWFYPLRMKVCQNQGGRVEDV